MSTTRPEVCVLVTDGTNCDIETAHAFELAGGAPRIVHMNDLRSNAYRLRDAEILALPGGFSYGDDVASGKVQASELLTQVRGQLQSFLDRRRPIIGICNGFQVLVRTGLLPFRKLGEMQVTLAHNEVGHFVCRPVKVEVEKSPCVFLRGLATWELEMPVAHGEGQFFADPHVLADIEAHNLVALRYRFDSNPNGSMHQIAGITDPTGTVLGLMPHPERAVEVTQFPNWRRNLPELAARKIFENAVEYVKAA